MLLLVGACQFTFWSLLGKTTIPEGGRQSFSKGKAPMRLWWFLLELCFWGLLLSIFVELEVFCLGPIWSSPTRTVSRKSAANWWSLWETHLVSFHKKQARCCKQCYEGLEIRKADNHASPKNFRTGASADSIHCFQVARSYPLDEVTGAWNNALRSRFFFMFCALWDFRIFMSFRDHDWLCCGSSDGPSLVQGNHGCHPGSGRAL